MKKPLPLYCYRFQDRHGKWRVIEIYYKSPEFLVLADTTKNTYRGSLEKLKEEHGDKRVSVLKRQHVKNIKAEMFDKKATANRLISVLAMVLDIAVDLEWISFNPARGIKPFKIKTQGWYSWTDNDINVCKLV